MKKQDFIGTKSLVKLALRRDRIRIPAWVLAIGLYSALVIVAYAEFSAKEMQELITMASISQGMRMLVSPIASDQVGQLGSFFLFRTSFLLSIIVSMMNIQLVTRHTRHNEESGCAEMISSTVAGRYASLAASLITAFIANLTLFALFVLGFIASGLPLEGSIAAAASFALIGMVFACVAAVTSQLSESSRGASGLASITFALAFFINAIGNVMGTVHEQSMGFSSSWIAWLSPVGWINQTQAFDQNRFAVLLLFAGLMLILFPAAVWLSKRRDIGRGILPAKRGPARASRFLTSAPGLAWRLQRKTLLSWMVIMLLIGITFGAVSQEYGASIEQIDVFQQFLLSADYFIFSMIAIVSSVLSLFTLQSLLRMRSEEAEGPLETFLSTPVRRFTWMLSFIGFSLLGTLVLLITFASGAGLAAQSSASETVEFIKASLYHGSAILVIAGLVITMFGLVPKIARGFSWILVMIAVLIGPVLGPMLNLPESIHNLSPFTHIALQPDQTSTAALVILTGIGLLLTLTGLAAFSRRSLKL